MHHIIMYIRQELSENIIVQIYSAFPAKAFLQPDESFARSIAKGIIRKVLYLKSILQIWG